MSGTLTTTRSRMRDTVVPVIENESDDVVTKLPDLTGISFSDLASLKVPEEMVADLRARIKKPGGMFLSGYNGSVEGEVDKKND